jgi:cobalt-zinc-cadmium efflux system membrane fusion protein
VNRKAIIIGIVLLIALGGGIIYRFTHLKTGNGSHAEKTEIAHQEEEPGGHDDNKGHKEKEEEHARDENHEEEGSLTMTAELQKQHGVIVVPAEKHPLGGAITVTGKVAVNADRIAHLSPRIPGKIVSVRASLGDSVSRSQALATLDSVELGEALSRYRQSKSRLQLAKNRLDRALALAEKKILARKEVFQAESDHQIAQAEMHSDEDRLSFYGVSASELKEGKHEKPLLTVRSPISGVITEKEAVVGELVDPARSLYTVADLSSVWVLVDINEKDLAKVHKGQEAMFTVGAFPDLKLQGRITHIADLVDEATRTVKARVEVANPGRKLKPEMFATVVLTLPADTPPVLAVPEEALQELHGEKVLFVTGDGVEFAPRKVALGRIAGGMAEVLSGLKEGERYAAKGSFLLKSELQKGELGEHGH